MKRLHLLLRIIIGVLFLGAGVAKLLDPAEFERDILAYRLIGGWAASAAAVYLPWLEVAAGLLLLLPRTARSAAAILLGLMGLFIGASAAAGARGIDTGCGCLGFEWDLAIGWVLTRDTVIAGALAAMLIANNSQSIDREREKVHSGDSAYRGELS